MNSKRMFLAVALLASVGPVYGGSRDSSDLPFCAESRSARFLSETDTAGWVPQTSVGTDGIISIPRAQVAAAVKAAIDGQDGFEALVQHAASTVGELLVLTKDQMLYDTRISTNPNGAFIVKSDFVESEPTNYYEVQCPTLSLDAVCEVTGGTPTGPSRFGQCRLKEDHPISEACIGSNYEVILIAVEGPHFLLGASNENTDCPNIAFDSVGGKRRSQFSTEDAAGAVAVHHGGFVSLRSILEAEKQAAEVNPTLLSFDLSTNTCVHYAGDIWRRLGMPESASLAEFVIENTVGDPHSERIAGEIEALNGGMGDLRILAARVITGGSNLVREKVKEAVYSQFIL
jgi:hypothetical protein